MVKPGRKLFADETALYRVFCTIGGLLISMALAAHFWSERFGYAYAVREMPVLWLVAGIFGAGVLFLLLVVVVKRIADFAAPAPRSIIIGIFAVGFLMRAVLLFSEPMLEDDWQRYLWDGGVVAAFKNPYVYSPQQVIDEDVPYPLVELGEHAPVILSRINHPELRTIYPIGAEIMFGLSHLAAPFSLTGWRLLILLCETVTFGLLLLILLQLQRPLIWLSLYWWNPLVVKELINSAHMEGVLIPFFVGGIYLYMRRRFQFSHLLIWIAASIKLWPALLAPFLWWRMRGNIWSLVLAGVIAALFIAAIAVPFLLTGLDETSGLVAYSLKWTTNAALFPLRL